MKHRTTPDYHTMLSVLRRTHRCLKQQIKARRSYRLLCESNAHLMALSRRTSSIFAQMAKYEAIELPPASALDLNFAVGIPHVTKAFVYSEYLFE